MFVSVTFERNGSHPKGEAQKNGGTFEWVQLTYGIVRTPNDEELASRTQDGLWETADGETWSDIIIGVKA